MKSIYLTWALVFAMSIMFFAHAADGGSLREDYGKFVRKRQQLEKQRRQFEVKIKALKLEQRKLSLELYKCVTKKQEDFWTNRLNEVQVESDKLESRRLALAPLRKDLNSVRQKVENVRVEVERRHRKKTKGSNYEIEFRQYMKDLDEQYLMRIETELFSGYQEYFSEIENHISFLKNSVGQCDNGG